jgi:hypothetical protein
MVLRKNEITEKGLKRPKETEFKEIFSDLHGFLKAINFTLLYSNPTLFHSLNPSPHPSQAVLPTHIN